MDGLSWSAHPPALPAEVASVLGRPRLRRYLSLAEAEPFDSDLARSSVARPSTPAPAVLATPDDDYLVALARATEVEAIFTGDLDLLSIEQPNLTVLNPRRHRRSPHALRSATRPACPTAWRIRAGGTPKLQGGTTHRLV